MNIKGYYHDVNDLRAQCSDFQILEELERFIVAGRGELVVNADAAEYTILGDDIGWSRIIDEPFEVAAEFDMDSSLWRARNFIRLAQLRFPETILALFGPVKEIYEEIFAIERAAYGTMPVDFYGDCVMVGDMSGQYKKFWQPLAPEVAASVLSYVKTRA